MLLAELRRGIVCGVMQLCRDRGWCSYGPVIAHAGPQALHPLGKF